jgi:signal transduction histidine kinase
MSARGEAADSVLEDLVLDIERVLGGGVLGSILLLDDDGVKLRHAAAPSLPREYIKALHVWSTPIEGANGRLLGTFALYYRTPRAPLPEQLHAIDIVKRTAAAVIERKRADAERDRLAASQRNFIAVLAHELRNPLSSIQGSVEIMRRSGQYNARSVDGILRQTQQLGRLITDLLDSTQIEDGRLQLRRDRSDLTAVLHACVDEVAALCSSHAIRVQAPEGPLDGFWDADRVMQVVRNLLSNAIKYSPDGGEVLVRLHASEQTADVSIADHGVGIAPEVVPRLFNPFYRAPSTATTVRGTGIGLYVSKQLIEAHGGSISIVSQLGEGTTITFRLPRNGASEARAYPLRSTTPSVDP